MVLQYSNQETSVTIGESVRDEDGMPPHPPIYLAWAFFGPSQSLFHKLTPHSPSLHTPNHRPRRYQRRPHGTPHHNQCLQNRLRPPHHCRNPQFPLRPPRQEGQITGTHNSEAHGQHAADGRLQPCHHHGLARKPNSRFLQRARRQPIRGAKYIAVD